MAERMKLIPQVVELLVLEDMIQICFGALCWEFPHYNTCAFTIFPFGHVLKTLFKMKVSTRICLNLDLYDSSEKIST